MAIETEGHTMGFSVLHLIHLINLTVTLHTGNPSVHVNSMVKINIIGSLMYLHPGHWLIFNKTLADGLKAGIVCQHRGVTFHAGFSRGNVGVPGLVHVIVAVPAIDAHLARVNLMGKRNRLNRLVSYPRVFGGKIIGNPRNYTGSCHQTTHH